MTLPSCGLGRSVIFSEVKPNASLAPRGHDLIWKEKLWRHWRYRGAYTTDALLRERANQSTRVDTKTGFYNKAVEVVYILISVTFLSPLPPPPPLFSFDLVPKSLTARTVNRKAAPMQHNKGHLTLSTCVRRWSWCHLPSHRLKI